MIDKTLKNRRIRELRKKYAAATPDSDRNLDVKLIPFLERLNSLPHVLTWNSCSSHQSYAEDYMGCGYLTIQLSRPKLNNFRKKYKELETSFLIKEIDPVNSGDGIYIRFMGKEWLEQSLSLIEGFLRGI